jgi:hypothetical protein
MAPKMKESKAKSTPAQVTRTPAELEAAAKFDLDRRARECHDEILAVLNKHNCAIATVAGIDGEGLIKTSWGVQAT